MISILDPWPVAGEVYRESFTFIHIPLSWAASLYSTSTYVYLGWTYRLKLFIVCVCALAMLMYRVRAHSSLDEREPRGLREGEASHVVIFHLYSKVWTYERIGDGHDGRM